MMDEQYTAHVLQGVEPGLDLRERRLLAGFGLAGETGEVTEPVKKWAWHHKPEPDREYMKKELGDVLWYLTLMASTFGLTLTEIMEANVAKLTARYPERHQTPIRGQNRLHEELMELEQLALPGFDPEDALPASNTLRDERR